MNRPLQITFRNMAASTTLEDEVRRRATELSEHCPRLMSCRVVIEAPHRHQRKGRHFHVRVDVTVADGELTAGHDKPDQVRHEDAHLAVTDAFRAMKRELSRWSERRHQHDGASLRDGVQGG